MIRKSVRTLQRWDKENIYKPESLSPKGHRLYSHQQYLEYINQPIELNKKTVVYCRVSSFNQKDDLKNQISYIENYLTNNQIHFDEVYEDIGSGLNYKRKNFIKLIKEITYSKINKIIITHKDRLVRFGFEMIEELCKEFNVEIIIINQDEKLTPQEEMVNDLLSIVHVFSSRLYGLRQYKSKIKEIAEITE